MTRPLASSVMPVGALSSVKLRPAGVASKKYAYLSATVAVRGGVLVNRALIGSRSKIVACATGTPGADATRVDARASERVTRGFDRNRYRVFV